MHAGIKPYACEICGKQFTRADRRADHMKLHDTEKSFICGICEKSFVSAPSLKRHILGHEKKGEGQYSTTDSISISLKPNQHRPTVDKPFGTDQH